MITTDLSLLTYQESFRKNSDSRDNNSDFLDRLNSAEIGELELRDYNMWNNPEYEREALPTEIKREQITRGNGITSNHELLNDTVKKSQNRVDDVHEFFFLREVGSLAGTVINDGQAQASSEHQDFITHFSSSIRTFNKAALKGDKVSELYEQKWYATGKLSYIDTNHAHISKEDTTSISSTLHIRNQSGYRPVNSLSLANYDNLNNPALLSVNRETKIENDVKSIQEERQVKYSSLQLGDLNYLKKRLTVVDKDSSLKIYLRDYSLSKQDSQSLVNIVIEHYTQLGEAIDTVTINGTPYGVTLTK